MNTDIVALGGGGFSEETDNLLLDDFILSLARSPKPRICFLPTASKDSQSYIDKFYRFFPPSRAIATHLSVAGGPDLSAASRLLLEQDVIYVGGGDTLEMLSVWKQHGIDRLLLEAAVQGVVLSGISAGMICWYEEFLTDSGDGTPKPGKKGLGLLKGSACPHYDNPDRRQAFKDFIGTGLLPDGIGAESRVALHYHNGRFQRAVTSDPKARAFRVSRQGSGTIETEIETKLLSTATLGER